MFYLIKVGDNSELIRKANKMLEDTENESDLAVIGKINTLLEEIFQYIRDTEAPHVPTIREVLCAREPITLVLCYSEGLKRSIDLLINRKFEIFDNSKIVIRKNEIEVRFSKNNCECKEN